MKQVINLLEEDLKPHELELISIWKKRKYTDDTPSLSIGQCLELLIAITYTFHKDYSDARFFNNILISQESVIAYDGDELIDTLFYEIKSLLYKRFSSTKIL